MHCGFGSHDSSDELIHFNAGMMLLRLCDECALALMDALRRRIEREEVPRSFEALGRAIYDKRPKLATGVYVARGQVSYGFRTNGSKMPDSFVRFEDIQNALAAK